MEFPLVSKKNAEAMLAITILIEQGYGVKQAFDMVFGATKPEDVSIPKPQPKPQKRDEISIPIGYRGHKG